MSQLRHKLRIVGASLDVTNGTEERHAPYGSGKELAYHIEAVGIVRVSFK